MRFLSLRVLALVLGLASLTGCAGMAGAPGGSGGAGAAASLDVINQGTEPIFYLYASSCSDSGWGSDRLGSDVIRAGSRMSFSLTSGCWDMKAQFESGEERVQRGVQIRGGATYTWRVS